MASSIPTRLATAAASRCIYAALAVLVLTACEPKDRTPGQWLRGELAETPADWNFTENFQEIALETHPWYGIPHSVTTVVATDGKKLYVPSIYEEELPFPGTKYWNRIIADYPEVRVKLGEKLFDLKARPLLDAEEHNYGLHQLAQKYPFWMNAQKNPDEAPPFVMIELSPTQ